MAVAEMFVSALAKLEGSPFYQDAVENLGEVRMNHPSLLHTLLPCKATFKLTGNFRVIKVGMIQYKNGHGYYKCFFPLSEPHYSIFLIRLSGLIYEHKSNILSIAGFPPFNAFYFWRGKTQLGPVRKEFVLPPSCA